MTFMALKHKKATTIALEPELDALLTSAARKNGVSRSEFIREQPRIVLEQYRRHSRPRSGGIIRRRLRERGNEADLFQSR